MSTHCTVKLPHLTAMLRVPRCETHLGSARSLDCPPTATSLPPAHCLHLCLVPPAGSLDGRPGRQNSACDCRRGSTLGRTPSGIRFRFCCHFPHYTSSLSTTTLPRTLAQGGILLGQFSSTLAPHHTGHGRVLVGTGPHTHPSTPTPFLYLSALATTFAFPPVHTSPLL